MTKSGSAIPGTSSANRRRPRWIVIAILLVVVLAGVTAWMVARSDWWLTPIQEAERALNSGDLTRAGLLLTRVIHDEPRQGHARLLFARYLRLSGRAPDADVALAKAMDLGVPEASLWREYGLLLADPDFRKAEPILRRALEAKPEDVEVIRALADGLSRQGLWPDAAELYSRWLRAEPGRTEALMGRSRALIQSGRSREAVTELRTILDREPENYEARLLLANAFLNNAGTAEAAPELEKCRRLRPDRPEPLVGLASCAIERDDLGQARAWLDQAIALDPNSLLALIARANLAMKLREYDRALDDFERVIVFDPANKQSHLHLAQILRRLGRQDRAEEHERTYRKLESEQAAQFRAIRGMR